MSSAVPPTVSAAPKDWVLANPWAWMGGGVTLCGLAWLSAALLPGAMIGVRWLCTALGLLSVAIALLIRFQSTGPALLQNLGPEMRLGILQILAGLFGLLAIALISAFIASIVWAMAGVIQPPWRPGQMFLISLVGIPVFAWSAVTCWRRRGPGVVVSAEQEAAMLFVLASLALAACNWALYQGPERAEEWSTMRMFLAVAALAALMAAPIMAAPQSVRRVALSLLFVLHFGAIGTAAMFVPPRPWVIEQIWARIYRPYLEFMYLGNAYRFYAPEPGPSGALWFRVFYEDPEGKLHGHWLKLPDLDDDGWHRHSVALEYQRYVAMYTNTIPATAAAPSSEEIKRRNDHAPGGFQVIVGDNAAKPALIVPYHPAGNLQSQYWVPAPYTRDLFETYVKFVFRQRHPEQPDWVAKKVKLYWVRHAIPSWQEMADGADPRNPVYYQPYFMGDYDSKGRLRDEDDPFLYWLLPVLHETDSRIKNWALRHAGDPKWVSVADPQTGRRRWVEDTDPRAK